ncbi:MAG: lysophospholipid acyltransferase (LPLAT)-like uncharacterized protein [Lentimonas sp.]|jgi:lysophospholipid acyltransferase (LPLAT)-like uncharacterized protein
MEEQQNVDEATTASSGARLPKKLQWQQRCVLSVLGGAMRLWTRTLRLHIRAEEQALIGESLQPAVYILWHNRLFVAPEFFRRFTPERKASAIISASNDGAWLAALVEQLGVKPIRGSRHGRAMQAFREMLRAIREGYNLGVTPDGSRGPMYEMKAGAATLALRTGAPIVLMSYNFSRAWRLKSWDRLYIPMPFSRVEVRLDRIADGKNLAGGDTKQAVVLLRKRLMLITEDDEYFEA